VTDKVTLRGWVKIPNRGILTPAQARYFREAMFGCSALPPECNRADGCPDGCVEFSESERRAVEAELTTVDLEFR